MSGNGYVRPAGTDPDFGIGLLVSADNLIESNIVTGNSTGIRINPVSTGNVIRGNTVAGNPPILTSNNAPENTAFGFDILNVSAAGANTFENNLCLTAVNAPCANQKLNSIVIPLATGAALDTQRVRVSSSFTATFSGTNLTSATYFDVRFRAPGTTADIEAPNWQQGLSGSHPIPQGTTLGDWTMTGVRPHLDANDHTGPYASVQATLSVIPF